MERCHAWEPFSFVENDACLLLPLRMAGSCWRSVALAPQVGSVIVNTMLGPRVNHLIDITSDNEAMDLGLFHVAICPELALETVDAGCLYLNLPGNGTSWNYRE